MVDPIAATCSLRRDARAGFLRFVGLGQPVPSPDNLRDFVSCRVDALKRGPEGKRGSEGPRGEKGEEGPRGPRGVTGDLGDVGPRGAQGPMGPQGPKGVQGVQGVKGDGGERGPRGESGPTGAKGDAGIKGEKGAKGDPGLSFADTFLDVAVASKLQEESPGLQCYDTSGGQQGGRIICALPDLDEGYFNILNLKPEYAVDAPSDKICVRDASNENIYECFDTYTDATRFVAGVSKLESDVASVASGLASAKNDLASKASVASDLASVRDDLASKASVASDLASVRDDLAIAKDDLESSAKEAAQIVIDNLKWANVDTQVGAFAKANGYVVHEGQCVFSPSVIVGWDDVGSELPSAAANEEAPVAAPTTLKTYHTKCTFGQGCRAFEVQVGMDGVVVAPEGEHRVTSAAPIGGDGKRGHYCYVKK